MFTYGKFQQRIKCVSNKNSVDNFLTSFDMYLRYDENIFGLARW